MKAPSSHSNSQVSHHPGPAPAGRAPTPAMPPMVRISLAFFALITTSTFALLQAPRPDPFNSPRPFVSQRWWGYPLEWNAPSRLPKIECDLRAIQTVPNTNYIWAAGNKGMLVVSTDGGVTWAKRDINIGQITSPASSPTAPPPTPSRSATSKAFLNLPNLVPVAAAAELSGDQSSFDDQAQQGPPKPLPTTDSSSGARSSAGTVSNPAITSAQQEIAANISQPTGNPQSLASLPQTTRQQGRASTTPAADPNSGSPNSVEAQSLIAVYFSDESRGAVISQTGRRFRTLDGGSRWSADALPMLTTFSPDEMQATQHYLISNEPLVANADGATYAGADDLGYYYIYFDRAPGFISRPSGFDARYLPAYAAHFLPDGKNVWMVGTKGYVWRSSDGGPTGINLQAGNNDLHAVYFIDTNRGWAGGSDGTFLTTSDGGATWQPQVSGTHSQLNAINFLPDGLHGWVAGNDGLILSTDDGGSTWVHRTQARDASGRYLRLPAPWYFVALVAMGLLLYRRREESGKPPEESVADVLVSDRPLDSPAGDVLSFNAIALGLSRFLRNENTLPPLTIAVVGEWGTGKSSLMSLLRADLRSYKFRPVWFNAWHHQKEEHMLASLLENVKLQAVPRWWTTRGIIFRARLLRIRGWRHWVPLMLLLFVIYVLLLYHFRQPGTDNDFAGLFQVLSGSFSGSTANQVSHLVALVPLLAGVVTFVGAVWRGITAFGVKPASLLAGVSSGVSIRNLEAQTSFRQKFALEFSDVTRALGQRSLLIFIDDLDRCRPENVLETLEAVNFLTTSGDCFVVIGMAREYVERCVGRAFKDIAEEMIDNVGAKAVPGEPEDQAKETRAKEKRIEFARQYLAKLINIEVAVPTAKTEQSLKLLLSGADEKREIEKQKPGLDFEVFLRYWKVIPALVIFASLVLGGSYLADNLRPGSPAQAAPSPSVSPVRLASTASSPEPTPNVTTQSGTSSPVATPDISNQRAEITQGGRALFSRNLVPVLGLLMLIWIGITIMTRRPGLIVKDSPRFVEALTVWHSVIFSRQSTPRSTKRFMNHVRYLAMRQRRSTDSSSFLRQMFFPEKPPPEAGAQDSDRLKPESLKAIPDEALVALAAIEHFNSSCLDEDYSASWPLAIELGSEERKLLTEAVAAHAAKFNGFDALQYRQRFLEMSAGLDGG